MLMQTSPLSVEFEQAYQWVMQQAASIQPKSQRVSLWQAQDFVLAKDIFAPINLPAWAQSAMDGYAINSQDMSETLEVLPTAFASGDSLKTYLKTGQTQRIMTGAPIPQGCDAVLPIEYAVLQSSEQAEQLLNPNLPNANWLSGKHIKAVGSDVQQGEMLLKKGQKLGAKQIALLASVGMAEVEVYAKPKVALLALGDELTEPGQTLTRGAVYNANQFLLHGLLSKLSVDLVAVESLTDDQALIKNRLTELGEQVDCILTVGGSSVGDKDWLPKILRASKHFRRFKINMKPAKPLLSAQVGQAQLLALPGNPIAAYFSFLLFAKPLLQVAGGLQKIPDYSDGEHYPIATDFPVSDKLQWFAAKLENGVVMPVQGSVSQLSVLQQTNGFIRVNANEKVGAGSKVRFFAECLC